MRAHSDHLRSLCGRIVQGVHHLGGHVLDEGQGAADDVAPLVLLLVPHDVPGLLPIRQAVVAPDVLHVVQVAHL